ncbi:hypothetical protein ACOZ38_42630 [Sphaerisporangium viridialbum]|uniref:hypothetical protein n=1 Tax=Sphaerisporangium viridialbum TaxID=46189 RepID=UPI003C732AEE
MPDISVTLTRWATINTAGLGLNSITFGVPGSNYGRKQDGAWVYLEGFVFTQDGEDYTAHITITKPPSSSNDSLNWTYCHLTVDRAGKNHVFYEVAGNGSFRLTSTLLDADGKVRNGKAHYSKDQINDGKLANALEHDMRLIFAYLA